MNKKIWISILVIVIIILAVWYFWKFNTPTTSMNQEMQQTPITVENSTTTTTTTATTTTTVTVQNRSITIVNFAFNPSSMIINKGDTVIWTNNDSVPHQVVGDTLASLKAPVMNNGQKYSYTFKDAGTFAYHCAIHPSMKGNIIVK